MADLPILDELRTQIGAAALREEERAARRRPHLGLARPLAGLAAAAGAAAFVLLGPGGGDPGLHSGQQAEPAITHLVYEGGTVRDGRPTITGRTEIWLSEDRCRGRIRSLHTGGRLRYEGAETPAEQRSYHADKRIVYVRGRGPRTMYEIGDIVRHFRELRKDGRLDDRGVRDGRRVLVQRDRNVVTTFLVDDERNVPIEILVRDGKRDGWAYRTVIRTYEQLPADPRLLAFTPRPNAKVVRQRTAQLRSGASRELTRLWCHPGGA